MRRQPLRQNLERLDNRILMGPGVVPPATRQAAARGEPSGGPLKDYLQKIRTHAYRVTDEEVLALRSAGLTDDAFELSVSTAYGAAKQRLDAGLAAITAVYGDDLKQPK